MKNAVNKKLTVARRQPASNGVRMCKECRKPLPGGKGVIATAARAMGFCRYCYLGNYPVREMWNRPPLRMGSRPLLSPSGRVWQEEHAFDRMEQLLWAPEFYAEWEEYIAARKRGEI